MKLEKMNWASMQKLSRGEMKKIMAGSGEESGGGCCVHDAGWANYKCGYSNAADAESVASQLAQSTGNHWYYCCASC